MKTTLMFFISLFLLAVPMSAFSDTPTDLKGAMIFLDNFIGNPNTTLVADVISMKHGEIKFRIGEKDYDCSGNYSVYLKTPRHHTNPYLGLGSPETAKLVILDNFWKSNADVQLSGQMILSKATIWEKSDGFIVAVAMDHEWILSGNYTIQN
jgi:hypothetical protein